MFMYFSTAKLYRFGFSKDEVKRAERCCLRRIARGRYVASGTCEDPAHESIWSLLKNSETVEFSEFGDMRDEMENLRVLTRARAEAIVTRSGRSRVTKGGEVFSHISAALIHGLALAYSATSRVEVSRPNISRKYRHLHVRNRHVPLGQQEVIGIYSVTTLERTLIDVSRDHNLDIAVAMVDDAIRTRRTSVSKIAEAMNECAELRADAAVHTVLKLADGRREAPSESIAGVRFHEHGIGGFEPQVEFHDQSGRVFARVDFCNEDARVIVEVDGIEKYFLGGGNARESIRREKAREAALEAMGYRVIRLSFGELFQAQPFSHILNVVTSRIRGRVDDS